METHFFDFMTLKSVYCFRDRGCSYMLSVFHPDLVEHFRFAALISKQIKLITPYKNVGFIDVVTRWTFNIASLRCWLHNG